VVVTSKDWLPALWLVQDWAHCRMTRFSVSCSCSQKRGKLSTALFSCPEPETVETSNFSNIVWQSIDLASLTCWKTVGQAFVELQRVSGGSLKPIAPCATSL